jgi:hypothetical protein
MTEAEWEACRNPLEILNFLHGRMSARKERLFACAAVRRIWHLLADARSKEAVEEAERYADQVGHEEDCALLCRRAWEAVREINDARPGAPGAYAAWKAASNAAVAAAATASLPGKGFELDPVRGAIFAASYAVKGAARSQYYAITDGSNASTLNAAEEAGSAGGEAGLRESVAQVALLHDLFGVAFRTPTFEISWRTTTVATVAQGAYRTRRLPAGILEPTGLAILADAIEQTGCINADILDHLRGLGPHVRGCWALDLVLGKA